MEPSDEPASVDPSVDPAAPAKPRYRIGKKKSTVPAASSPAEPAPPAVEAPPASEPTTELAPPAPTAHPTSVDAPPPLHPLPGAGPGLPAAPAAPPAPPPPPAPAGQPPSLATQPLPSRPRQGNCSLPFGWLEAPRGGGPDCSLHGLVPVKCPLSDRFDLGPAERWTPNDAVEACGGPGLVGLVIDLTNTSRYYSPAELPRGVLHLKLPIAGHGVPGEALVRRAG